MSGINLIVLNLHKGDYSIVGPPQLPFAIVSGCSGARVLGCPGAQVPRMWLIHAILIDPPTDRFDIAFPVRGIDKI